MPAQVSSPPESVSRSSTFEASDQNAMSNPPSQPRRRGSSAVSSQSTKPASRHQCPLCEKSYERSDHVSRHLLSHDNHRSFQCSRCGKGFNRLDLLNRHVLGHVQKKANGKAQAITRSKERTAQACKECVAAKTKCEDDKPCRRCRTRGTPCTRPNTSASEIPVANTYPQSPERSHTSSRSLSVGLQETQTELENASPSGNTAAAKHPEPTIDDSANLDYEMLDAHQTSLLSGDQTFDLQPEAYPAFFEQIMMPQTEGSIINQDPVIPPDVSNFVQDIDFSLQDFDFQFPGPFPMMDPFSDDVTGDGNEGEMSSPQSSTLSLRADAFQSSSWEWVPPQNHDSLSEQKDISIIEGDVPRDEELQATMQRQWLSELLTVESRDRILVMVLNICSSNHSISSFPSKTLLARVMQAFYLHEAESLEGRAHPNTLSLSTARPELLLAIIAAGAMTFNSEAIRKMGIALQEIVRLAVAELFERDNSLTRDLQALQAYMLWLDVGLWSGYKRSMEIAGSFLQPLHTLLIKAKAFARDNHRATEVHADDSADVIQLLWQDWRAKESLKRIAVQAFLHDSRASLALLKNPIISYAQMTVPLPCSRNLWMASDSQSWARLLISGTASILSYSPTLLDVFSNIEILDGMETKVDTYLCYLTALHATAASVWEYRQQAAFSHNIYSTLDETTDLLSHAFQSHTYKTLTKLRSKCDTFGQSAPEVILLAEFLMMFLNVSLDDIQRFAGKDGERDAREIVPAMRKWCSGKEARRAIWHAGQVLRAAKSFRHTQLRGFHAVAVYFSALTLWVYGLITYDTDLHSGINTPTRGESVTAQTPWERQISRNLLGNGLTSTYHDVAAVVLDGQEAAETRLFIMFNQGRPGLTATKNKHDDSTMQKSPFCNLRHTKSVMMNAAAILQANYSNKSDSPPLMVRTLIDLMKKLAELSGSGK